MSVIRVVLHNNLIFFGSPASTASRPTAVALTKMSIRARFQSWWWVVEEENNHQHQKQACLLVFEVGGWWWLVVVVTGGGGVKRKAVVSMQGDGG